jgi:hypothetical protein
MSSLTYTNLLIKAEKSKHSPKVTMDNHNLSPGNLASQCAVRAYKMEKLARSRGVAQQKACLSHTRPWVQSLGSGR